MRRIQATDAGAVAAAVGASLDHLRPWMPWATPDSADRHSQLARVAEADEMWESGISYIYSVLTAGQGTLVGEIGLHRRGSDATIEIGYWIAGSQARRGFGTSAAAATTLGYRLDRLQERQPEAPGESGRLMIWVRERVEAGGSAGPRQRLSRPASAGRTGRPRRSRSVSGGCDAVAEQQMASLPESLSSASAWTSSSR